ncbi:sorting nexin [Nowakowskiella sp. JEL0078]|nr:sorting nexin [Nowakowskiella sp. JEL0078]
MTGKRKFSPKPVFDEVLLFSALEEIGISGASASRITSKIWRFLLQKDVNRFEDIPELPKNVLKLLSDEFCILSSKLIRKTDASDGSTTKLLIELQDGQRIESVIMRYGDVMLDSFPDEEKLKIKLEQESGATKKFKSNKRATLCVSCQIGCAMACTFCATGTMGLKGNLCSGEIIEQLVHANNVEKIRNIVFMGMGEPLDSYPSVLASIRAMTDTGRFGLSPSRISVSTVGVIPRIYSLMEDAPDIGLALSLHAPTQALRTQIVPTAKAWPLNKLIEAANSFVTAQNSKVKSHNRRRRVLCEYVIIANINDSEEVAHDLGRLLKGMDFLLNVIPYNVTSVPFDYKTPHKDVVNKFVEIVRSYDVHTLLRQTLGSDVNSACGQLVINDAKDRASDVEMELLDALAGVGNTSIGGCTEDSGNFDLEDMLKPDINKKVIKVTKKKENVNFEKSIESKENINKKGPSPKGVVIGTITTMSITLCALLMWKIIRQKI